MILDDILQAVVDAVQATTPEDDDGAPAQFAELAAGDLAETGQDRNFVVESLRIADREWTGTPGYAERTVELDLRIKYINEGRSRRRALCLVAQDGQRLQDTVVAAVRGVPGVGAFDSNGLAAINDGDDPSVVYLVIPYVCEYTDEIVVN